MTDADNIVNTYRELLNNIFEVAPYLASITLTSVGSVYAENPNATSPENDYQYLPHLDFALTSASLNNLSLPAIKQLKTMWKLDKKEHFSKELNDEAIHYMLKSRSKELLKLLSIAALESNVVTIKNNHPLNKKYVFTYKEIEKSLLSVTFHTPSLSLENHYSNEFKKALLKL